MKIRVVIVALVIAAVLIMSLGRFQVSQATSADPYLDKQWALQKIQIGQIASNNKPVLVAVVDTGIDEKHEDLAGKIVANINFGNSQTAADVNGHGTHIAGIIAATTNNGVGVAGVAANAQLLNVKVADDNGMVWSSTVAKGIVWAVDNGAKVINLSLAIPTKSEVLEKAIEYAWNKGAVVVAGAGNNVKGVPMYPACYPEVIAVAAIDAEGSLWTKSNDGDWVDVYAPGAEIYSTLPGNNYGYQSGTSMATAYVSGVAALAFATATDVNGNGLVNDEVIDLLKTVFAIPN